jgi:hypothetical protein
MSVQLLKLVLTPLLIAGASLAQRKWGSALAGLLAGLPLTSAPISVFLAVERGSVFAAHAARGTLLGTVAMCTFCVAYAHTARWVSWPLASAAGLAACGLTTVAMSLVPDGLGLSAGIALAGVAVLSALIGRPRRSVPARSASWWDLPARMLVATGLVLLITTGAGRLGPTWSGLLASLPVFSSVLGAFTHSRFGADAAQALLRGICFSAFGVLAFFVIVGSLVERLGLPLTYSLAACCALGVSAACRPLAANTTNEAVEAPQHR